MHSDKCYWIIDYVREPNWDEQRGWSKSKHIEQIGRYSIECYRNKGYSARDHKSRANMHSRVDSCPRTRRVIGATNFAQIGCHFIQRIRNEEASVCLLECAITQTPEVNANLSHTLRLPSSYNKNNNIAIIIPTNEFQHRSCSSFGVRSLRTLNSWRECPAFR